MYPNKLQANRIQRDLLVIHERGCFSHLFNTKPPRQERHGVSLFLPAPLIFHTLFTWHPNRNHIHNVWPLSRNWTQLELEPLISMSVVESIQCGLIIGSLEVGWIFFECLHNHHFKLLPKFDINHGSSMKFFAGRENTIFCCQRSVEL
jgi:hypothetical protein